jgi:hypothetical protein
VTPGGVITLVGLIALIVWLAYRLVRKIRHLPSRHAGRTMTEEELRRWNR